MGVREEEVEWLTLLGLGERKSKAQSDAIVKDENVLVNLSLG